MDDSLRFEYYYGIEAEQFSFYRVPRMLIKDERFKVLSSDAKLLYGLMLDRMALSMKNGWFDEENRAYIHYTIDNIMEDFNCAKATATKILAELDGKKGIGLIEKKRQGLGKPDIIYVKNFVVTEQMKEADEQVNDMSDVDDLVEIQKSAFQVSVNEEVEDLESELPETQNLGIKKSNYQTSRGSESELPEVQNLGNRKFDSENTGSSESELPEVQNLGNKKFDNLISRSSKIEPQEVQKSNSKYNNNSYTDMSYINQSYQSDQSDNPERCDGFDETAMLMSLVKSNIEYDSIMQNAQWKDWELYEELYEIICEVVCVKRKNVRIGGEDYPYELVKSKFMKLNSSHLLYVIECMQNTTSRITNIKSYMVTALYNAPNTMNHYYQQAVQHDMYGGGWQEKGIV